MTVWRIEPVSVLPHITLNAWSVFEVPMDGPNKPWTTHFTGFALEKCKGQVSSPVEKFDPSTRCGVTRSERVYQLEGPPGCNSDAFYVWGLWRHVNRIPDTEERDISDAVYARILSAGLGG